MEMPRFAPEENPPTPEIDMEMPMNLRERNILQAEVLRLMDFSKEDVTSYGGVGIDWLAEKAESISDFIDGKIPELIDEARRVRELTAENNFREAAKIVINTLNLNQTS